MCLSVLVSHKGSGAFEEEKLPQDIAPLREQQNNELIEQKRFRRIEKGNRIKNRPETNLLSVKDQPKQSGNEPLIPSCVFTRVGGVLKWHLIVAIVTQEAVNPGNTAMYICPKRLYPM